MPFNQHAIFTPKAATIHKPPRSQGQITLPSIMQPLVGLFDNTSEGSDICDEYNQSTLQTVNSFIQSETSTLDERLALCKEAIVSRTIIKATIESHCSNQIFWMITSVRNLVTKDPQIKARIDQWERDVEKEVDSKIGKGGLARLLRLSQETRARMSDYESRIQTYWSINDISRIFGQIPIHSLSRNFLESLAVLSESLHLDEARRLVEEQVAERIIREDRRRSERTKTGAKIRGGPAPFGKKVTLSDVQTAVNIAREHNVVSNESLSLYKSGTRKSSKRTRRGPPLNKSLPRQSHPGVEPARRVEMCTDPLREQENARCAYEEESDEDMIVVKRGNDNAEHEERAPSDRNVDEFQLLVDPQAVGAHEDETEGCKSPKPSSPGDITETSVESVEIGRGVGLTSVAGDLVEAEFSSFRVSPSVSKLKDGSAHDQSFSPPASSPTCDRKQPEAMGSWNIMGQKRRRISSDMVTSARQSTPAPEPEIIRSSPTPIKTLEGDSSLSMSQLSALPPSTVDGAVASMAPQEHLSATAIQLLLDFLRTEEVFIFDPQWYDSERPRQLEVPASGRKANLLLLPLHDAERSHWTLAVLNLPTLTIQHYNSIVQDVTDLGVKLRSSAGGIRPGEWTFASSPTPKQPNAFDCGIYTILAALCVVAHRDPPNRIRGDCWRRIFQAMLRPTSRVSSLNEDVTSQGARGTDRAHIQESTISFARADMSLQSISENIATFRSTTLDTLCRYRERYDDAFAAKRSADFASDLLHFFHSEAAQRAERVNKQRDCFVGELKTHSDLLSLYDQLSVLKDPNMLGSLQARQRAAEREASKLAQKETVLRGRARGLDAGVEAAKTASDAWNEVMQRYGKEVDDASGGVEELKRILLKEVELLQPVG